MANTKPFRNGTHRLFAYRQSWLMAYGLWLMAYGLWLMACGLWLVACGLWLVARGTCAWSLSHGDELRIRPAQRRMGDVLGKLTKFSPDFMAQGRGQSIEDERDAL